MVETAENQTISAMLLHIAQKWREESQALLSGETIISEHAPEIFAGSAEDEKTTDDNKDVIQIGQENQTEFEDQSGFGNSSAETIIISAKEASLKKDALNQDIDATQSNPNLADTALNFDSESETSGDENDIDDVVPNDINDDNNNDENGDEVDTLTETIIITDDLPEIPVPGMGDDSQNMKPAVDQTLMVGSNQQSANDLADTTVDEEDELEKTIMISEPHQVRIQPDHTAHSGQGQGSNQVDSVPPVQPESNFEEDLDKTVVISSGNTGFSPSGSRPSVPKSTPVQESDQIYVSPPTMPESDFQMSVSTKSGDFLENDDMTQTVVLGPYEGMAHQSESDRSQPPRNITGNQAKETDDLAQTSKKTFTNTREDIHKHKTQNEFEDDGELDATVVIQKLPKPGTK